jgi:hypothetical protein
MYVEYCNYSSYIDDYEIEKLKVFNAIQCGINGLAMPTHFIREIKEFIPKEIVLAAPIDYPSGYASSKTRNHSVLDSIKSGANAVDYVLNQYLLRNKYKELFKEVETINKICTDNKAELRVFLDYDRISNPELLANTLLKMNINKCFPVLGYHKEEFSDTLIMCHELEEKTGISTIFNGHILTKHQLNTINKSKIYGYRLYYLDIWCKLN